MSISHYLLVHYNTHIEVGRKAKCNLCNSQKKTLSLKRDDSLAKCFRCGVYFIEASDDLVFDSHKNKGVKL
jgi:hypothetical protein